MKDVEIGMITGPLGIRGEVKIKSYAEDPSRFKKIREIGLRADGKDAGDYIIEHARISGGMVVVKLAGVDDRNAAELLRNMEVFMDRDDLEPLEPGEHYVRDLIGMTVIDDETGEKIGTLGDVLTDRPQDIYVVAADDGTDFMVPAVPEFVRGIDDDERVIRLRLIEGIR
ncbi:MAG: 16S rRNA processing protein RimM [Eubacterium sp.]|nr:16S rRNA processing protein RimM [Eubacterium sp.]